MWSSSIRDRRLCRPLSSWSRNRVALNDRIRPWEEHAFMVVVFPAHTVRRAPVGPLDGENDRLAVVRSDPVTSHRDLVSDGSSHNRCLLVR